MNLRKALSLLVAALALGLLGWMGVRLIDSDEPARGGVEMPVAKNAETRDAADVAGLPEELAEPLAPVPGEETERREVEVEEEPEEPEWKARGEKQWLAGRVVLPAGTPADERLLVLAIEQEEDAEDLYESPGPAVRAWDEPPRLGGSLVSMAEVEADGGFRIALPADAGEAHLALSGRYVFSRHSRRVALPAVEPPVLEGELGTWITGVLVRPAGEAHAAVALEAEVQLGPDLTGGFDAFAIQNEAWELEDETEDGRFELRAANPTLTHALAVRHEVFATELVLGIEGEPGQHVQLEVPLKAGATLRGRVTDENGAPVGGGEVAVLYRGVLGQALDELREGECDEDGTFELTGVATGKLELRAEHEGYRDARLKVEQEVFDGDVLDGFALVLDRGLSVTGTVAFPDGRPAEKAHVTANPDYGSAGGGMGNAALARAASGTAVADEEGRFEVTGLSDVKYVVTAAVDQDWKAKRKGLEPGGPALELVLERLGVVAGRVTDLEGNPVTAFEVQATLQGSGAMMGFGAERSRTDGDDEEGRFELKGLVPGTWEVSVIAKDYGKGIQEAVVPVPADAPELLFALAPAAAVEGLVLDVGGSPVSGAKVTLELDLTARMEAMRAGGAPETYTDHEGAFRLDGVDPGELNLVASLDGFAASEPVPVELEAGAVVRDVVLRLRLGGTLTGEVLNDDGEPDAGRMVIVQKMPSYGSQHMLTVDADGGFRVEHLEPGSWQVVATANFLSGDAEVDQGDEDSMADFLGNMKIEFVEMVDGEELHVVLGAPPEDPVTLVGRVVHGGEPIAGALVSIIPEDAGSLGALKMQVTKADGSFRADLDKPGNYLVTVQRNAGVGLQQNTEFLERIPDGVEEHEMVIEMPIGRVSGTVRGPKGDPLSGCRVTLNVEGGVAYGTFMGGHYAESMTDDNGWYDIDCLSPGTYTVAAGGVTMGGAFGGGAAGGRTIRSGIDLSEGEWIDSLDFRLEKPGDLNGLVRDTSGRPVADAAVFVRDEEGKLLEHFTLVTTDRSGRFSYEGLAPGRYCFSARTSEGASAQSDLVRVRAGEAAAAEVTLEVGTMLRVTVVDESDEEVRARLSVEDDQGREYSTMRSMQEIMDSLGGEFSSQEHRIGPIPPGTYRLTATTDDGRNATKPVTLGGQEERKIKLRLR